MTVCPIAIAAGCKNCPMFSLCPLKSVIGDYKNEDPNTESGADQQAADAKQK